MTIQPTCRHPRFDLCLQPLQTACPRNDAPCLPTPSAKNPRQAATAIDPSLARYEIPPNPADPQHICQL